MGIADLIDQRALPQGQRLTTEMEFLPGFSVTIGHLTMAEYKRMLKKAQRTVFIEHQKQSQADEAKLAEQLAQVVLGWQGLTTRLLSRMFWLPIGDLDEQAKDAQVPHSQEEARELILRHEGFANWLLANAMNPANFSEALEQAEKNLPSGPASGPGPAGCPAPAAMN